MFDLSEVISEQSQKHPKIFNGSFLVGIVCLLLLISFTLVSSLFAKDYTPFVPNSSSFKEAINYLPTDLNYSHKKLASLRNLSQGNKARQFYILGVLEQKKGNLNAAYNYFNSINLKSIPFLSDRVLLHQLEIKRQQGDEMELSNFARKIINGHSHSLSVPEAYYELGRSYIRQGKKAAAQSTFKELKKKFPNSQYSEESLYYLGELSSNKNTKIDLWSKYLQHNPNSLFAQFITTELEKAPQILSQQQQSYLGLYYFKQKQYQKAYKFLRLDLNKSTWYALANTEIELNKKIQAKQTLQKSLSQWGDDNNFNNGINLFIRHMSIVERNKLFDQLISKYPRHAPYILWRKLSYTKNKYSKLRIYKKLTNHYPDSVYSGFASSNIFWHYIKEKQYQRAEQVAYRHLERFRNSYYTSKVVYWLGKIKEKQGNFQEAKKFYKIVIDEFPFSYYAYRVSNRYSRWKPATINWSKVNHLKFYQTGDDWNFPPPASDIKKLNPTVQELLSLNLWREAFSLLDKDYATKYPALHIWKTANINNNPRDAINDAGFKLKQNKASFNDNVDYWLLAYPLKYWDYVIYYSKKYKVDPILILSIIRQESRFQETVVSRSGAVGLCQLLPATAREMSHGTGQRFSKDKLYKPAYNIELAAKYIKYLTKRFNNNYEISAGSYNSGPNAMQRWLNKSPTQDKDYFLENIEYKETREYIFHVMENYWVYTNLLLKYYSDES